ncbi:MAG: metalloregulator ArsR/SmtB family transcription factor [Sinobacterium sp.]|nr:metalloregulator ArsR/SmtB family transcription factor [Sinobacterium sp.]
MQTLDTPITSSKIANAAGSHGINSTICPSLACLLKAAGDEFRLQVLKVLNRDSFGVLELCTIFSIKQSALSHHLKVLANAGLVTTRREGNSIFYRRAHTITPQELLPLQQSILNSSNLLSLSADIQQGISTVQQERSLNSQQFFTDNTNKFKAQQDLIASLEQYGPAVEELCRSLPSFNKVVEIGPGEGEFLLVLSRIFQHVNAIDSSESMLAKSQALIEKEQCDNVSLVLGNTALAAQKDLRADCVIANMVLHHTPNPAEIFHDLSQCLISGGSLIICDLLSHDQSWTRENCGDVWLGFDENELSEWAIAANLAPTQETYLTLRNGFRIQVRQFLKH